MSVAYNKQKKFPAFLNSKRAVPYARLKRTNSLSLLVKLFYIFIDINGNVHAYTISTSLPDSLCEIFPKKPHFTKVQYS